MATYEEFVFQTSSPLTLPGAAVPGNPLYFQDVDLTPPPARFEWIGSADSEAQVLLRAPLHENRKITVRVRVAQQSTMDLAQNAIASLVDVLKAAMDEPNGLPLQWTPANSTRSVLFDVLAGEVRELPLGDSDRMAWLLRLPSFTVELTCKPYWRAAAEVLPSATTASLPLITHALTGVGGDIPALGRLIVTDNATQNRRHVEWGMEGPAANHSLALLLDSDSLTTSGTGGSQTTATGSYDPNSSGNNVISAPMGPVWSVVAKTGNQSHVGTYRVQARMQNAGTIDTFARFSWQRLGGEFVTGDSMLVAPGGWRKIELGTITIPEASVGTQQWSGYISGYRPNGTFSGGNLILDYILLIPTDAGYGKARGSYITEAGPLVNRDNFIGIAGGTTLNARTADLGGSWATSGVSIDFTSQPTMPYAGGWGEARATTGNASRRYAILGTTNHTDTQAQVTINGEYVAGQEWNLLARWVDSSNHLLLTYNGGTLTLQKIISGTPTVYASAPTFLVGNNTYILNLTVYASGRAVGYVSEVDGTPASPILEAQDSVLATSGTLAAGEAGFADSNTSAQSTYRWYTNFYVSTPPAESLAIASGRGMRVTSDETIRQDSSGTYWGLPGSYIGTRFLVPVGNSRVAVKARRYDSDATYDEGVTDSTSVQVGYTERGLVVPRD